MSATRLTVPEDVDMYVTFALSASQAIGAKTAGSIKQGPNATAVSSITVPPNERWDVTDISSLAGVVTNGVDAMLEFMVNNYSQAVSCRVSSTSLALNTRFRLLSSVVLPESCTWSINHVGLVAMGTNTGIVQDLNLRIRKTPRK